LNRIASNEMKTRLTPLVLFLIFSIVPQGATASFVVCIESDGQINIEAAHQGICYQNSKDYSLEIPYLPLSGESSLIQTHYVPCIDIAISVSDLKQNIVPEQGLNKLINVLQHAFTVFPQFLCRANVSEEFSSLFPLLNNSIISSLSSTILLI